jgi:MFS family permease
MSSDSLLDQERPPISYQTPSPQRRWQAGTLTYTAAGLVVLFCWLLWGDFAWSMKERSVHPIVQLLLRRFHASDTVATILLGSLPAAIGIFLGPIISYRSDRHRGRWGRRIPYLLWTTPIAAAAIIALAFCPPLGRATHAVLGPRSPGENFTILIYFGLFWTVFEFATVAANAVFGGLINDVVPRQFLGRFYGLFRALSLIAGMVFNFWLIGKAESHYAWLFIGVGLLYAIGFTMMCLKVKEGDYPPPPPPASDTRGAGFFAAVRVYVRECFSRPYYVWVFMAWNLGQLAFIPVNLLSVYYAQSLNIDMTTYGRYITITYGISLVLSYLLGAVADRVHPLRAGMAALVLYAIASLLGGIYATTPTMFAVAFVAHGVISGTYFTTTASLQQRLFPHSRFAQFSSAATMFTAISTMLLGFVVGPVIDLNDHSYRLTFIMGFGITLLCIVSFAIVHRGFMALGGPKGYVAPGDSEPQPEKGQQIAEARPAH